MKPSADPAAQSVHRPKPAAAPYLPTPQLAQAALLEAEARPRAQSRQAAAEVAPELGEYLPAGQPVQGEAASEKVPAGQGSAQGDVRPGSPARPAAQPPLDEDDRNRKARMI